MEGSRSITLRSIFRHRTISMPSAQPSRVSSCLEVTRHRCKMLPHSNTQPMQFRPQKWSGDSQSSEALAPQTRLRDPSQACSTT